MTAKRKLTLKQRKFIAAYDGNASEAARKAGYSKKTYPFIGAENLKKPQIAEALAARESKQTKKLIADREARQQFWSETMLAKRREMQDRLRASELLGKSEGDFLDRVQHDVTGNLAELVQAAVSQLTTAGISPIAAAVLGKKGGK
jgi:phage terminase small subunit